MKSKQVLIDEMTRNGWITVTGTNPDGSTAYVTTERGQKVASWLATQHHFYYEMQVAQIIDPSIKIRRQREEQTQ